MSKVHAVKGVIFAMAIAGITSGLSLPASLPGNCTDCQSTSTGQTDITSISWELQRKVGVDWLTAGTGSFTIVAGGLDRSDCINNATNCGSRECKKSIAVYATADEVIDNSLDQIEWMTKYGEGDCPVSSAGNLIDLDSPDEYEPGPVNIFPGVSTTHYLSATCGGDAQCFLFSVVVVTIDTNYYRLVWSPGQSASYSIKCTACKTSTGT